MSMRIDVRPGDYVRLMYTGGFHGRLRMIPYRLDGTWVRIHTTSGAPGAADWFSGGAHVQLNSDCISAVEREGRPHMVRGEDMEWVS